MKRDKLLSFSLLKNIKTATMKKEQYLKWLGFSNEYIEIFLEIDFAKTTIQLHRSVGLKNIFTDIFIALEIPFEVVADSHKNILGSEHVIHISYNTDLRIIYFIAFITHHKMAGFFPFFITSGSSENSNCSDINNQKGKVSLGVLTHPEYSWNGVSEEISSFQLVIFKVYKLDWIEMEELYPNINDWGGDVERYRTDGEENIDDDIILDYPNTYIKGADGLTRRYIDDVLGGEKDAYWNID